MASGHNHDTATRLWCLPLGITAGMLMGWSSGLITGAAFLIGGLWLSPDLDTRSRALRRWGPLQLLWWPYRRLIPHRSLFSHGPLIGTALRLSYLLALLALLLLLLSPLGLPAPARAAAAIQDLLQAQPQAILSLLLGLEASVWLHLIQDGDPMPHEWRRWRHR
ncbi:MAG: metal-binding protein [Prochlorococcus sp.]|nr:metal-binding protein [Prochlorococcaceae cyanobacterium Fu_MAG_50]